MLSEIRLSGEDLIFKPLTWQIQGRHQSKSGYGRKLISHYCIQYNGKLRRVYHCIYGNSGTLYIEDCDKNWIVID